MKTQLVCLWVTLFAYSFAFAQDGTWEKFVQRSEKGAEIFWIQADENRLPTQAQYQPLNGKTKVTLAYIGKGGDGGETVQDHAIFKNKQTGETYKMFGFMMSGLVVMPDEAQKEFYPENVYAYNTERLYITPPPIVAYVYYSNNSLPIAQPITKDICEQDDYDSVWNCKGIVPITKAKCTIKYEPNKGIITLTTPKGIKVFKEIKE